MLTELGGAIVAGAGDSPLTSLEGMTSTSEFEYIESQLADPYCGDPLQTASSPGSPSKVGRVSSSSCLPSLLYSDNTGDDALHEPYLDGTAHYENDLVSLDRVPNAYDDDLKYEDLQYDTSLKYEDVMQESSCSPDTLPPETPHAGGSDFSASEYSPPETVEEAAFGENSPSFSPEEVCIGKGKVSDLQRSALDAIFHVTDRPSRNLVLHIASELHLHHVTVKNFFSNARRRVRRAAARLSDPERSRRENRRRKEKRKLAALAAAAAADGRTISGTTGASNSPAYLDSIAGMKNMGGGPVSSAAVRANAVCEGVRESYSVVSPQRRALMEKLADKVQRSAAQRGLSAAVEGGGSGGGGGSNMMVGLTNGSVALNINMMDIPSSTMDISRTALTTNVVADTDGAGAGPLITVNSNLMRDTSLTSCGSVMRDTSLTNSSSVMRDTSLTGGSRILRDTSLSNGSHVLRDTSLSNASHLLRDTSLLSGSHLIRDTSLSSCSHVMRDTSLPSGSHMIGDNSLTGIRNGLGKTSMTAASHMGGMPIMSGMVGVTNTTDSARIVNMARVTSIPITSTMANISDMNNVSDLSVINEMAGVSNMNIINDVAGINSMTGIRDLSLVGNLTGVSNIIGVNDMTSDSDLNGICDITGVSGMTNVNNMTSVSDMTDVSDSTDVSEMADVCDMTGENGMSGLNSDMSDNMTGGLISRESSPLYGGGPSWPQTLLQETLQYSDQWDLQGCTDLQHIY